MIQNIAIAKHTHFHCSAIANYLVLKQFNYKIILITKLLDAQKHTHTHNTGKYTIIRYTVCIALRFTVFASSQRDVFDARAYMHFSWPGVIYLNSLWLVLAYFPSSHSSPNDRMQI